MVLYNRFLPQKKCNEWREFGHPPTEEKLTYLEGTIYCSMEWETREKLPSWDRTCSTYTAYRIKELVEVQQANLEVQQAILEQLQILNSKIG